MFWDDEKESKEYVVPDDVVDLNFKINCTHLPLDHAYDLHSAIKQALPWLEDEPEAAVHLIHGAESGNGWIRPEGPNEVIYPSRRTLFSIRTPNHRLEAVKTLNGSTLVVGDIPVALSKPSVRPLSKLTTIFARHLIAENDDNEENFLNQVLVLLEEKNIRPKKMMSGRLHSLQFPDHAIYTRSLMLDGLDVQESVTLQQQGLGDGRLFGCGIFLPHKGIDAVNETQEK